MKSKHKNLLLLFLMAFLVNFFFTLSVHASSNSDTAPKLTNYVTDNTGVLSSEFKSALENVMIELEKSTNGVQFVIYVESEIPTGLSLEDRSLQIAEQNKIGKSQNNNGLLLYIAVDDKQYRWETGYGLESTLSAPLLGRISREQLEPEFKKGNYEQGLFNAVNTTTYILLNSEDADVKKLIESSQEGKQPKNPFNKLVIIVLIIFIVLIIIKILKNKNKPLSFTRNNSFYTNSASNIFKGGFGRGGSGGFSGGGGSFGGGGHSGGW